MFRLIPIMVLVFIMTAAQAQTPDVPVFDLTGTGQDNIASVIEQAGYLKASNADGNDGFGDVVAIDGNVAVVGSYGEDSGNGDPNDNSAESAGAAYVYVREGNTWVQRAYLKASNAEADDRFGESVAISGDTIVIGAAQEDSNGSSPDDNSTENAGAAYVFVQQGDTWVQQAYLKPNNMDADDRFGSAVAIDGNTILIGAHSEDGNGSDPNDNSAITAGATYVFIRQGDAWTQQAYLKANNTDAGDRFGESLALDGDSALIGATGEGSNGTDPSDNSISYSGAAYIFVRQGDTWTQQAYLKANNTDDSDEYGTAVAIDGNTAIIGAISEASDGSSPDDNSADGAGAAYIYVREGANWTQQAYLKSPNTFEGDQFGESVAVAGDVAAVGAPYGEPIGVDPSSKDDGGEVHLFRFNGATWQHEKHLESANIDAADSFGWSIAMDDDTVIIGASEEDSNGSSPDDNSFNRAGAAYVFSLYPKFESAPVAPGPLMMQGIAGTPASMTFAIGNTASSVTQLDVSVQSITPGYSVVSGLPVVALSTSPFQVTIQCDNPGTTPVNGTLVLVTNEFGTPTHNYDLVCQMDSSTPTPPPSETPAPVTGRVAPFDGQAIATGDEYISRFQWTSIEGAEWYHVFVWTGEADGIIHDQWYEAAAVCADGLCTSQDIWLMSAGEFSWWMTRWSEEIGDGYIDLYAESRFSVTMPAPGAITGLSPIGDVAGSAETLTLSWAREANTLWYQVWTGTADYQSTSFYEWLYAPDVCSGETCSISIPMPAVGDHEFWLQAWNPAGLADWQQMTVYSIIE